MFQPSEFLCPAQKLPLLFQLSHYHLVKSVSYVDKFIQIVKDSQALLSTSSSFLGQVHRTHENMFSMFGTLSAAVDSKNTQLLKALPKEIQQWVCELLEELHGLMERWERFNVTLNAIWRRTNKGKNNVVQADFDPVIDYFMDLNPGLEMHLKAASLLLADAASVPQDILFFLHSIQNQLQARKQEWRKVQLLLDCQDPKIKESINLAKENWHPLSSQCLVVNKAFDERRINVIYKLILQRDPQDLTEEEWKVEKESTWARISQLNTQDCQ